MNCAAKSLFCLLVAVLASGCAHQGPKPLYYWGSYQNQMYGHFKGEKGPDEQIQALEADAEKASSEGLTLPPGYRAHLGMLYGETGRTDKMASNLQAEKERFPESAGFMDFLLKHFKSEEHR